jgi:hypothetical protein
VPISQRLPSRHAAPRHADLRPDVAILVNAAPPSTADASPGPSLLTQYFNRLGQLLELNPEDGELLAFGPDSGRLCEPPTTVTPTLATLADPKGHSQAMKRPDSDAWSAAELKELDNHATHGSFTLIDASQAQKIAAERGVPLNVCGAVWV